MNPIIPTAKTPEPRACSYGFHKWTVWSNEKAINIAMYTDTAGTVNRVELRQERTCLRCNKIESRSSL